MNPLQFLSPYKTLIEAILIGGAIVGIGIGIHEFLQHEQDIGYKKAEAEYQAKLLQATQEAREKENLLTRQLQEAQNAATQREQTIRTLTAAAGAASNSLHNTIDAISRGVPTATIGALRNTTTTLAAVFTECQDRYRSLGEKADRHASDVKTLTDAWPK